MSNTKTFMNAKYYHPDLSKNGMVIMKKNKSGEWVKLDDYFDLREAFIEQEKRIVRLIKRIADMEHDLHKLKAISES